jgi:hypothetical protein
LLDAYHRYSQESIVPMFGEMKKKREITSTISLFQILNPNPEAMSKIVTENSSEEFLYSLSNYCALQVSWRMSFIYSSLDQNKHSQMHET